MKKKLLPKKIKIFDILTIALALAVLILAIFFFHLSKKGMEVAHICEDKLIWNGDGYFAGTSTKKGQEIIFKVIIYNGTADIYLHSGKPKQHSSDIKEKDIIIEDMNVTETEIKYIVKNEKIMSFYIDTYGYKDIEVDYIVKDKYNVYYLFLSTIFFMLAFIFLYVIVINIEVKRKAVIDISNNRVFDMLIKYLSKNNYKIESKNPKEGKIRAKRVTFFNTTGEIYNFVIERLSKNTTKLLISANTIHNISHNSKFFINRNIDEILDFIKNFRRYRGIKK